MKAALYLRVSTEEQAVRGYSIEAQKEALQAYALKKGWEIAGIYEDAGYSAKNINRPALQRLLKDIEDKKVEAVLVWRLDRISRSVADFSDVIEIFEKHGVTFDSATENIDTSTPSGRALVNFLAVFAQFERESIGERSRLGKLKKVQMGNPALGLPPYGYKIEDGQYQINEAEAEVVRLIFKLCVDNHWGYRKIASYLNELGLKTRQGGFWNYGSISSILNNPIYPGLIVWNRTKSVKGKTLKRPKSEWIKVKGNFPPIISEEIFDVASSRIKERGRNGRSLSSVYALSGIIRCGVCGMSYCVNPRKDRGIINYFCSSRKGKGKIVCENRTVNGTKIEKLLISKLIEATQKEKELIVASFKEEDKHEEILKEIKNISIAIDRLQARKKKIFELYEDGEIDKTILKDRIKELESEMALLKSREEELYSRQNKQKNLKHEHEAFFKAIENFGKIIDLVAPSEKKALIRAILQAIIVHPERVEAIFKTGYSLTLTDYEKSLKEKIRPLTEKEQKQIKELVLRGNIRAKAVLLSSDGLSAWEIAGLLGIHPGRIRYAIREFNRRGISSLFRDLQPKPPLPWEMKLADIIASNGQMSLNKLAEELKNCGYNVSPYMVKAAIRKNNLILNRRKGILS
jgi:site-specific DNA recombinase